MKLGRTANVVVARILAHTNAQPKRIQHVRSFAFEERTPPKEIQLWNAGDNPTDYGVHKWTARSIADVLARYNARGNPLLIDVEHLGAKADDEPAPTGGYARLEVRDGAPWLVFDWSKYGVEQITTGQRRFLSPEYDVDTSTGEIVALYRVSLVADPGTHRARMLAAAAAFKQENGMDPKLAAIMAILSSVADPAAAIDAIKSLVASLDGGGGDAPPADATTAAPDGDKPAMADAPPPGGDAPDKDKDKVAAAAAPAPTTTPAASSASSPSSSTTPSAPPPAAPAPAQTDTVAAAAAAAVTQIANAQRDHLLQTKGDLLDPSIRRWAASQPFAVVQGLINAAPEKQTPTGRVNATRGEGHGTQPDPQGLQGEELEQLRRQMGTYKAAAVEPHMKADGTLVIPTVPPSQIRARKAAAPPTAPAAGKDGK